ncbi:essential MCU regulator, mitochondrial [Stigmatopora argus]
MTVLLYRRWVALLANHIDNVIVPHYYRAAFSMASALGRLGLVSARRKVLTSSANTATTRRTVVFSSSGAILAQPEKTPFGIWRIAAVVVPFLYLGTRISKNFAELLEEHDIFYPEVDDDDDD